MLVGAEAAQRESGLPVSLMQTIQALVVVFVVAGDALSARLRAAAWRDRRRGGTWPRGGMSGVIGLLAQSDVVTLAFWSASSLPGVRLAVSVGTAAIGEMINERAGVLNLGLEGVMLLGGFAGFAASFESGSPWVGLVCGAGRRRGRRRRLRRASSCYLRVDQVVAGLGLTLFGIAFTAFLNRELYGGGIEPAPDAAARPTSRSPCSPTSRSSARRCSPRTSSSTSPSASWSRCRRRAAAQLLADRRSTPPVRRPTPPTPPATP